MTRTQFWKALTERYGYSCPLFCPIEGVSEEMEKHEEWCTKNCAKIQATETHYRCWKEFWNELQNR